MRRIILGSDMASSSIHLLVFFSLIFNHVSLVLGLLIDISILISLFVVWHEAIFGFFV